MCVCERDAWDCYIRFGAHCAKCISKCKQLVDFVGFTVGLHKFLIKSVDSRNRKCDWLWFSHQINHIQFARTQRAFLLLYRPNWVQSGGTSRHLIQHTIIKTCSYLAKSKPFLKSNIEVQILRQLFYPIHIELIWVEWRWGIVVWFQQNISTQSWKYAISLIWLLSFQEKRKPNTSRLFLLYLQH